MTGLRDQHKDNITSQTVSFHLQNSNLEYINFFNSYIKVKCETSLKPVPVS